MVVAVMPTANDVTQARIRSKIDAAQVGERTNGGVVQWPELVDVNKVMV